MCKNLLTWVLFFIQNDPHYSNTLREQKSIPSKHTRTTKGMISSEIRNEDELGSVSHMLSADGLAFYNVGYTHAE